MAPVITLLTFILGPWMVAYDEAACSMSRDFFGNIRTVPT